VSHAARSRPRHARGFTLLEVLVAVAILGLGLTAILSAQFSAVAGVKHARGLSGALGLGRCKMSEIEERLAREGFAELDEHDRGPCCEGGDESGYVCEWHIDKPVFPEPELGELDLDSTLDGTSLGALGQLGEGSEGSSATPPTTPSDLAGMLGGDLSEVASGGIGGVAALVMGLVYPDLKRLFEASTRRVTVIVRWREGSLDQDFELVQWLARPQLPPAEALAEGADGSAAAATGPHTPGPSTTPSPAGGTR
jgi:general secretion pathway protein I